MPTYSYKCTECGTAFDIQQAFTDDSLTVCPNCSGKLRKIFTAVGVTFNGSGFYRTDSRGKSETGAKSDSGGKSETSTAPAKSAPESTPKAPAASPSKAAG